MEELIKEREILRKSLIGDYMHDLPIRIKIHKLTVLIEGNDTSNRS